MNSWKLRDVRAERALYVVRKNIHTKGLDWKYYKDLIIELVVQQGPVTSSGTERRYGHGDL
jgi:hypothetical protein